MHAYRHPESVDPGASLVVAEDAAMALEALGDDVGVARARYLMCELAWLQGRSERALREARDVVRFARLAGDTVELDAGVSVVAWALVVNRAPVPDARAECEELLRERRRASLRRARRARLRRGARRHGGRLRRAPDQLARSRDGLTDLGLHQASIWMAMFDAQAQLLAGDPAAPRPRSPTPSASRARSAIAGSSPRSSSTAPTSCSPRSAPRTPPPRWSPSRRCPSPNDIEWSIKRLRGPRQARRPRGPRRAGAGRGARGGRAGRADRAVPLPHRRLARSRRGRRSRGRAGGGGGGARDGAALLPGQGQRGRRRSARRRRAAELSR